MAQVIGESAAARPHARPAATRAITVWLLAMAALVLAMVVLGGVTRLTQSGLSMVEWQPIMGVLPPLSEAAWQEAFAKYREFPEYQQINRGMALAEFKTIFWFEYAHRVLGRAVGVVFILPFLWFLVRRRIPAGLTPKLFVMLALGGLQGVLGWYMVQSGLVDRPDVSAYRLTAHLGLAVVIYGYILWTALGLLLPRPTDTTHASHAAAPPRALSAPPGWYRIGLFGVLGLVFVTLLSGGFVAGNDAGLAYNTFPLMNGAIIPPDLFELEPLWRNFFEHLPLVQLDHRLLAMLTVAAVLVLWLASWWAPASGRLRTATHILAVLAIAQLGLGIATLLTYVPVPLGAAHQIGAMATLTAALVACRLVVAEGRVRRAV